MRQAFIIITILILNIAFAIEDNSMTQVLNPQFKGAELSIPKSINFQGYLNRDGNPMDTTMDMWFGIYDSPGGSNLIYQQTKLNVEIINGWFTVNLADIPDLVFNVEGPIRYLEVKAPATLPPLEPRISLVSVGYSYHSYTSDTAEYARLAQVSRPIFPPIEAPEIGDNMVTHPKLADSAVNSIKIHDGSIRGVDIAKPCTLQGSASYPNGLLQIKNTGTGHGIRIGPANWLGISIDSTGSHGVYVYRANDAGVLVYSADDGFYVNNASRYGVNVNNAGIEGMYIGNAAQNGCHIEKANINGLVVDSARYGLNINRAANSGVKIDSSTVGAWVSQTDQAAYYVGHAGYYGLEVWRADINGVQVFHASQDGFSIDSAGNYGVYAKGENGGVYGKGPTSYNGGNGVTGYARNIGVFGQSTYWEGVSGEAGVDDAVEGYYNGTITSYAGVRGRRDSYGYGVYYEGGIGGTGEKSTIVKTSKGPVALYSQESPENWFEDFGEGRLVNGHCRIELDKLFLETVTINDRYPIKVFVQLTSGKPMNLVVKKDLNGFDLIAEDLTSDATFDYRVVAKRKGFEDLRLKTEEIGYTDHLLYPDPTDQQIPTKIRAKRLEEIEKRKKDDEIRKTNQIENFRKEVKSSKIEINKPEGGRNE